MAADKILLSCGTRDCFAPLLLANFSPSQVFRHSSFIDLYAPLLLHLSPLLRLSSDLATSPAYIPAIMDSCSRCSSMLTALLKISLARQFSRRAYRSATVPYGPVEVPHFNATADNARRRYQYRYFPYLRPPIISWILLPPLLKYAFSLPPRREFQRANQLRRDGPACRERRRCDFAGFSMIILRLRLVPHSQIGFGGHIHDSS